VPYGRRSGSSPAAAILHELEALEQMGRGSVVEQYREVSRPGAGGKGRDDALGAGEIFAFAL